MRDDAAAPLVWARKKAALRTCPVSYISAESQAWLEDYLVRRRLGSFDMDALSARQVEAFVILEKEYVQEIQDARNNSRQTL
jgi:hypothetical protein